MDQHRQNNTQLVVLIHFFEQGFGGEGVGKTCLHMSVFVREILVSLCLYTLLLSAHVWKGCSGDVRNQQGRIRKSNHPSFR